MPAPQITTSAVIVTSGLAFLGVPSLASAAPGQDGGSKRRAVVEETLKGLGGKVEAFYYAFGDADVVAIFDLPDNASATAVALTVAATGAVHLKTTVLISAEEVDQATHAALAPRSPSALYAGVTRRRAWLDFGGASRTQRVPRSSRRLPTPARCRSTDRASSPPALH